MTGALYTGTAAREIDRIAIDEVGIAGLDLMTRAGASAFQLIKRQFECPGSMLVLCGGGNNGGDGYVVARCALEDGWSVTLVALAEASTPDAGAACQQYLDAGGEIQSSMDSLDASEYSVIVDGLLGIGLTGEPREPYASCLRKANQLVGFKLALDVPSGVNADTGQVFQPAFNADVTITFIVPKIGLFTGPATSIVGMVSVESLGLDPEIPSRVNACANLITRPHLQRRAKDSHKGDYGTTAITGGDHGMFGAVLLAGRAALRSGSGKVYVVSTDEHLDSPALYTPELMSAVFEGRLASPLDTADAIVLGPGMGLARWGRDLFAAVIESDRPLVVDADALTVLAETDLRSHLGNWVLTPHPGEAARLLGCTTRDIQQDRLAAALEIARSRNAVCVLKGAGTLVATAEGEAGLCDRGNPGMATAGAGDVLSGVIGALLAQSYAPAVAARAGVWLHARAADLMVQRVGEISLIAGDIIEGLPDALISASEYDQ